MTFVKVKHANDHNIIETATCGQIREILAGGEYSGLDLAVAIDIHPTKAHFHTTFDEIYFVLDGAQTLKTFDPSTGKREEHQLGMNELCLVTKGMHHQITQASEKNRLCIISVPCWIANDEHLSDSI
jgi:mannose-6-phosphate isomerase-like protein (cupin superfamily)